MNEKSQPGLVSEPINSSAKGNPYRVTYTEGLATVYLVKQDKSRAVSLARKIAQHHCPPGWKVGRRLWSRGRDVYVYAYELSKIEEESAA